jgi:hypothetical protein
VSPKNTMSCTGSISTGFHCCLQVGRGQRRGARVDKDGEGCDSRVTLDTGRHRARVQGAKGCDGRAAEVSDVLAKTSCVAMEAERRQADGHGWPGAVTGRRPCMGGWASSLGGRSVM